MVSPCCVGTRDLQQVPTNNTYQLPILSEIQQPPWPSGLLRRPRVRFPAGSKVFRLWFLSEIFCKSHIKPLYTGLLQKSLFKYLHFFSIPFSSIPFVCGFMAFKKWVTSRLKCANSSYSLSSPHSFPIILFYTTSGDTMPHQRAKNAKMKITRLMFLNKYST